MPILAFGENRLVIDIDRLTEAELRDLNRRIVERLRFINQMRAHATMLQFSVGERIWFQSDYGLPIHGVITKYNRKTVNVSTDHHGEWRVPPSALRKVVAAEAEIIPQDTLKLIAPRGG